MSLEFSGNSKTRGARPESSRQRRTEREIGMGGI